MTTKLKIVTQFSRGELWQVVDSYDLAVEDRRKLDDLYDAVLRLPKAALREVLLEFDRDRLKQLCRWLDLEDGGRLKVEIVDRLLGTQESESESDNGAGAQNTPRSDLGEHGQILSTLVLGELLLLADQYEISVEDRRKREDVLLAVTKLSSAQLRAVFEFFPRDRLKEICRGLGLDDSGREKAKLISRVLDEQTPDSEGNRVDDLPDVTVPNPADDERTAGDTQPGRPEKAEKLEKLDGNTIVKPRPPRLFIGSTVEALPVAHEMQAELDHDFESTIWSQSLFGPGIGIWAQLVGIARNFDFALFVFSDDDVVDSRGRSGPAPRDNLLLEYGLFVGVLGIDKTFFLVNRDHPLKIASDLAGVPPLTYRDRYDGNLQAAVGPACTLLRKHAKIKRL